MTSGFLRVAALVVAVLLGMAALAAWLVPPMLDWNRYRADIADLVSGNLGRAVTIEGPISLSLLPEPILTAGKVSIAGLSEANQPGAGAPDDSAGGVTIRVDQLRLRLALMPLLSGHVDARELVLRGLDVQLPWPLGPDPLALRAPTWLSSISARIEEGRLSVGGVAATHIDASLGLVPDTGSISVGGTAQISGQTWHMTARLTRSGADGSSGLDLSLDGQGPVQGLGAMFSGQIAPDGSLAGRISGRGPDLSRLIAAPAVPFRADGRLSIAAGLAVAQDLAMEIAGSPARGAVALRLGQNLRLDVSLAASRLDLDAWLPALLRSASGRIVAGIPTGIDLSAEAATLAGGTLRGLRSSFELQADSIGLRDAAVILPGDAQLNLAGKVRRGADAGIVFDGTASVVAANLRITLAWLEAMGLGSLSTLPPGVLQTADLRAHVLAETATPRVALADLNGTIDASEVKGTLTLRPGTRLGVAGALSLNRLALDPWWPAEFGGLAGLPTRLGRMDLDVQLRADQARLQGQTLAPASIDVLLEAGRLTVRKLEVQQETTKLVASGTIQDSGRMADGRLELTAAADSGARLVGTWWPVVAPVTTRLPRGPVTLVLQASGPMEALVVRTTADIGDLHVEATPTLDITNNRWTAPVTLRHPGAPRLLDNIGLGNTAAWLGDGSASWAGTVVATGGILTPTRLSTDAFDVAAGGLRATGALVLDRTGTPKLSGRIVADTLPVPWPYPRAPDPLPTGALAGWQLAVKLDAAQVLVDQTQVLQQAAGTLSLNDGVLRLEGGSAKLDGGTLAGAVTFDSVSSPPSVKADVTLTGARPPGAVFDLPLDISGGSVDVATTLAASGYSPAALLATLSGTFRATARDGVLSGVDLGRIGPSLDQADLRSALSGGSMMFDRFDLAADLHNGAADITASSMKAPTGAGSLLGLLDIAGRTAELRMVLRPAVEDPPELALRLSGKIDAPSRSLELADAVRWRALHTPGPMPVPGPGPVKP